MDVTKFVKRLYSPTDTSTKIKNIKVKGTENNAVLGIQSYKLISTDLFALNIYNSNLIQIFILMQVKENTH